jgi:hypothetical protein
MDRSQLKHVEQLLEIPKTLTLALFEEYVGELMGRSQDGTLAAQELDAMLALVQNHVQLLSLYVKQNYLINKSAGIAAEQVEYYTKQEIANKYRVSIRTVTNWIIDGLEAEDVGGVKRISKQAIDAFRRSAKGKKFNWRSIVKY